MKREISLRGSHHGIWDVNTVVFARRDSPPAVRAGQYYRIRQIVETETGRCAKHLMIGLFDVDGLYSRNSFKVNEECIRMMGNGNYE